MKPNRTWKLAVATVSSGAVAAAALTGGAAFAENTEVEERAPITVTAVDETVDAEQEARRFTGAQVAADARTKAPGTPALPARLNAEERQAGDATAQSDTPDSPQSAETPQSAATPDSPESVDTPDSPEDDEE